MIHPGNLLTLARRSLANERQMFVVLNVAVNILLIGRSYVTMQVLDYRALGLAALLQSIVLLVSTLQLGFLNGGFRLICAAEGEEAARINNLIYTSFTLIALVSLVAAGIGLAFVNGPATVLVALLGVVGGVLTLVRTWMTNTLIAAGRLRRLNGINFWSSLGALVPLLFIPVDPLVACLVAVIGQPAAFVLAVAIYEPRQLPTRLLWPSALVRHVLRAGFMLFLSGLLVQLSFQFERWYVTAALGIPALGHLYLAFLFITLFQMVPTSLDQLFLPQIIRAHQDRGDPSHAIRQYLIVALVYCALVTLVLVALAEPLTRLTLPRYVPDLPYVYLVAPGLILFTLSSPFAMIYNVTMRFRFYFAAFGGAMVLTAAGLYGSWALGQRLGLESVMLLRSGVYAFTAVVLVIGYWRLSHNARAFRVGLRRRGGALSVAEVE